MSKILPSYFYTGSNTALIVNTVDIVHASCRQLPDCGHHKPRTKKQGRWETKSVGRYIHGSTLPTVVWCTHISFTSPAPLDVISWFRFVLAGWSSAIVTIPRSSLVLIFVSQGVNFKPVEPGGTEINKQDS